MSDDYMPPEPSPRRRAALFLADALFSAGLRAADDAVGSERSAGGRCHVVTFVRDRPAVRGKVLVFSDAYFRVAWKVDSVDRLPRDGSRVFDHAEAAAAFCRLAFRDLDAASALQVPVRSSS